MSELLITHKVRKVYMNGRKEVRAVDSVDIKIARGSSTAIIGPSGAGKSTLLHMLGGLDRPTSGHVALDGVDIYKLPDRERARIRNKRVGFVFQFYHLLPEFTALENVMMPALMNKSKIQNPSPPNGGIPPRAELRAGKSEIRNRAMEALKAVGLANRMNHKPGELSGGESQRVAIARAIINRPEILLCDEPTGNLDSVSSEGVYELLFGLKESSGLTLVVVTHDEKLAKRTGEAIRIKDGRVF